MRHGASKSKTKSRSKTKSKSKSKSKIFNTEGTEDFTEGTEGSLGIIFGLGLRAGFVAGR
jgi:hypothetical protein